MTNVTETLKYQVQSSAKISRNGFPYFEHHDSVSDLWSRKWQRPCAAGIYPFMDGNVADFEPIFADLIEASNDDPAILDRPDDYVKPFLIAGDKLVAQAEKAFDDDRRETARNLFLRAAAVYRIGRFPIVRSPLGREAWTKGKAAYEKGAQLLDPPIAAVDIPFAHANAMAGDTDTVIRAYLRLPKGRAPKGGWPVLLFICGLDAYKTDNTPRTQQHVDRGYATLLFEIPGTGDCPAAPNDPTSPDRLMSSVLDWVEASASHYGFDLKTVVARGISTGGYYAIRVAHTHADRLFAVAAQGGGCHHMFDKPWIFAQDQMEYPFALAEALAYKFGYRDADHAAGIAAYADDAGKFSLVTSCILGSPTCKLLVINGVEDSIFPIEDSFIVAKSATNIDLIVRGGLSHMGNPGGEEILLEWIDKTVSAASKD
jgi:hypothetical protein